MKTIDARIAELMQTAEKLNALSALASLSFTSVEDTLTGEDVAVLLASIAIYEASKNIDEVLPTGSRVHKRELVDSVVIRERIGG